MHTHDESAMMEARLKVIPLHIRAHRSPALLDLGTGA